MNRLVMKRLSPREQEIAILLTEGYSCPDIARKLYISSHTVKTHCKKIYNKLNVSSRIKLLKLLA